MFERYEPAHKICVLIASTIKVQMSQRDVCAILPDPMLICIISVHIHDIYERVSHDGYILYLLFLGPDKQSFRA